MENLVSSVLGTGSNKSENARLVLIINRAICHGEGAATRYLAGQAQPVPVLFGVETQRRGLNAIQAVYQALQSRDGNLFSPSNIVTVEVEEALNDHFRVVRC